MDSKEPIIQVRIADWTTDAPRLQQIRHQVFCLEQGCPRELEEDGRDADAQHVLACWRGQPAGTGRLLASGKITRMAVLPAFRGRGVGRAILAQLLDLARNRELDQVYLHAQEQAVPFYETAGFVVQGPTFKEADMPHRKMIFRLTD